MDQTTPKIYSGILQRLAEVRRKQNISEMAAGGMLTVAVALLVFTIADVIEQISFLGTGWRMGIFWVVLLAVASVFSLYFVVPFLKLVGLLADEPDEGTAGRVGKHFPQVKDHLVNILQIKRELASSRYSPDLIDASFEDVRIEINSIDFRASVNFNKLKKLTRYAGTAATGLAIIFLLSPASFSDAAYRLLNFTQDFTKPLPFRIIVEPGDKEVLKGESIRITVRIEGEQQREVLFASKPLGQAMYDEEHLQADGSGKFSHDLSSLKSTTTYHARVGDIASREFTLKVVDRPVVKMLRTNLAFPGYARLASLQLDDNIGDVSALRGTRISVSIESNKELSSAHLIFEDGKKLPLTMAGSKTTGTFDLLRDGSYHIRLRDTENLENADPIEYTLKVIQDAYPVVKVLFPGMSIDIAENARLNMLFKISDDYGFTSLRLAHKLIHSRYERPADEYTYSSVLLPSGVRTEGEVAYLWDLSPMSLVPEDVVSYYVEVFDNDNVSGPKSGRSEIFTLRLPSLEEVFADVERGHEVSLEGLKEALKHAEQAKKDADNLRQDLKKNQKMDWQQQKKAEEVLKKFDEARKKIDEVNKTIEKMVQEMEKNTLLSEETLEKYQELQSLMEQMSSPEFAEAMKRLQQSMQQMNPEALRQAMENFKFSEENFRQSIERTMNLLKRIQIEQKVDETLKRAEEIQKKMDDLQNKTEKTNPSDKKGMDDLAQQQKDLKDQLDQLQRELADLQKKMEEFPSEMPLDEMDKAREMLEQSNLDEEMEEIAQQLSLQQRQQAMQGQQQAEKKMKSLRQQLQAMKDALQQNQQRQIVNEMRKAMKDLLELSRRQEALKNESQSMDPNSQRFRENAQQQMEILRDLANVTSSLSKLSQKTFAITPEMGKSIGDAIRRMNEAMQSLEQRNGQNAGQQQGSAMASLNEAAQMVQNSLNAMMQGGGAGMGMAGFMQRLQQMSGMQQGINQGTQQMQQMAQQQMAEMMGRLAAEQGAVRKSLEQLAREATQSGEMSKMLGDLNRIAQEMREVQTDMAQGNVNPETLRKQERILSRLLDSQRSMRERDYEKRRRAESGTTITRRSPVDIDLSTQEGQNRLRQDMQKALDEGYAKDYEELIRKYFEALQKLEKQN